MAPDLDLAALSAELDAADLIDLARSLPIDTAADLLAQLGGDEAAVAPSPIAMARHLDSDFVSRPHLEYVSARIAQAVKDVEEGRERRLIIEMPPRSGKTFLVTQNSMAWIMAKHPDWPIVLSSYSSELVISWSRQIRRWVEQGALGSQVQLADDSSRADGWETTAGGKLTARSLGGGTTGFGAKVLVIDDPHKDFADVQSKRQRDLVWEWWLGVGSTRLHPPALVVVIMTRWHEDDLVGRLLSKEYPGEPSDWEVIRLGALAEEGDVLGREVGEPLLSPLVDETREEALERWARVRRDSGEHTWAALYQQRPAPAEGAILNVERFVFWTRDPEKVASDGSVVLLPEEQKLRGGTWLDSWDMTFKGTEASDWVVGQRWVRVGANRFLIAQQRGRWDFVQSLEAMRRWVNERDSATNPFGHLVHRRLVEEAANGPAIISALRGEVSGLEPVKARVSKEARARAVSPEIDSGNVFLPHPRDPGNEWVVELLSELREFPHGAHDDQVDALTQALSGLRGAVGGRTVVPRGRIRR